MTKFKHGGKRIPGPGKHLGPPRRKGYSKLYRLWFIDEDEEVEVKRLTPRERTQKLIKGE